MRSLIFTALFSIMFASCSQQNKFENMLALEDCYKLAKDNVEGFPLIDTIKYKHEFTNAYMELNDYERKQYVIYRDSVRKAIKEELENIKLSKKEALKLLTD